VASRGGPRGASAGLDEALFSDYEQLKRFFYLFMFQASVAHEIVGADGMAFLESIVRAEPG
jgi:hypothetical protein